MNDTPWTKVKRYVKYKVQVPKKKRKGKRGSGHKKMKRRGCENTPVYAMLENSVYNFLINILLKISDHEN